jgi:cell division protein YceG involved in septum cleavage
MKKNIIFVFILLVLFFISCDNSDKTTVKKVINDNKHIVIKTNEINKPVLPDLKDETIIMNDGVFECFPLLTKPLNFINFSYVCDRV